ncbi:Tc toxin subunit A-related protein [Kribbella sp. CWNU-51]
MAALHADLTYTYRRHKAVVPAQTGPTEVLAQIERLLIAASTAYRERRYAEAIDAYMAVRRLIWSQLAPLVTFDEVIIAKIDLIPALLSYSAEFLNLLTIEEPTAGARPREEPVVDPDSPLGLFSGKVTRAGSLAAADLELAHQLQARGNAQSAEFFRSRALARDPEFVALLEHAEPPVPAAPQRERAEGNVGHAIVPAHDRAAAAAAPQDIVTETSTIGIPVQLTAADRSYAVRVGDTVERVSWKVGDAPASHDILKAVYEGRKEIEGFSDSLLHPRGPADVAISLTHAFYYETPLGLAEAYHAMGDYGQAEAWYVTAAGYQYVNPKAEAPYVWARLATCHLDHGNTLFRADNAAAALPIYEKVLTVDGAAPAGAALYTLPGLAPASVQAAQVIANLATPEHIDRAAVSPAISVVIFEVHAQLAKIAGGLDFWGHSATNVPIWTFEYLQQVATTFCQLAIGAERDAISFWEKADSGSLTRMQLTQSVQVSTAELAAANRQTDAALAELDVYRTAENVARLRAANARANYADYTERSWFWTLHQALSSQLSGGENRTPDELNQLADRIMSQAYTEARSATQLAVAEGLAAARLQRDYEIHAMDRHAQELDAAADQAAYERVASQARLDATRAGANAAGVRVDAAEELLEAFDEQRFTPDVWHAMGERMNSLARRYLMMALDIAKRMQRAYNFENDVEVSIVRPDYQAQTVSGLLAADSLLADIQAFTYQLITSTDSAPQPIRQTVSLAARYPFLFETQFRRTGRMEFQTGFDDFDAKYPGTYAGRIVTVEVEVDGIVPARGLSGTLTNSGVSHYRVPARRSPAGASGVKHRLQPMESLVLSDYDQRQDAIVVASDRRLRAVFEGAGLASTWTLSLPPEANELDYASIVDVRLTFTYQARFDPDLRDRVVAELQAAPAVNERQRPFPLRWLFPDAFFSFYTGGTLAVTLGGSDFAATERDPRLLGVGLTVVTTPLAAVDGLALRVTLPGATAAVHVTCDEDGAVEADAFAAALTTAGQQNVLGQSAHGAYTIEVRTADNPGLDLEAIDNIALILGYSYTRRG